MCTVSLPAFVLTHLCLAISGRGDFFQSVLRVEVGLVLGDTHGAVVQKVGKHWVKHTHADLLN